MVKQRVPLQASPKFLEQMRKLRMKVYANGNEISYYQITERIADPKTFLKVELDILKDMDEVEKDLIRMDRRRR